MTDLEKRANRQDKQRQYDHAKEVAKIAADNEARNIAEMIRTRAVQALQPSQFTAPRYATQSLPTASQVPPNVPIQA